VKHPTEFQVGDRTPQRRRVGRDRVERGIVSLRAGQLEQLGAVLEAGVQVGQRADDAVEQLLFLAELLCAFLIFPDLGILELAHDRVQPGRLRIEVKDTSADRTHAAEDRTADWRSG
jgi:hypothetical protein